MKTDGFLRYTDFYAAFKGLLNLVLQHGSNIKEQNCREIWGVAYVVLNPEPRINLLRLVGIPEEWARLEFKERVSGKPLNPGIAWKAWQSIFKPRLREGLFTYTYAERLAEQWAPLLNRLQTTPTTRRGILCIWDRRSDLYQPKEVPCTIACQYTIRYGALQALYYTRSNDLVNFWVADTYLYAKMQEWIAEKLGVKRGRLMHITGSLHIYFKDLKFAETLMEKLERKNEGNHSTVVP